MYEIAMIHWMRAEPLEATVGRLARCGYDGIEINGDPTLYDAHAVGALLERFGVRPVGAVTLTSTKGRDLIHPEKSARLDALKYLKDTIDFVSEIGGRLVCCVPSAVGRTSSETSATSEWQWCIEGLTEAAALAGELDVSIAIEAICRFETNFINRCDQALAMVAEVDLPNVGICLDTYHMNMEENDMLDAIRQARGHLLDFHVADNNRKPPGQGSLNWTAILETLTEIDYRGPLTAEVDYPLDRSPLSPYVSDEGRLPADAYDRVVCDTVGFLRPLMMHVANR
jgi:sugar phosphate isomerase/epimerase